MKRGLLLILAGVLAIAWFVLPASGEPTSSPGSSQRTTTTLAVTTTPSTEPATTAATVATTVATTAVTAAPTTVAVADATPRDDPAATRLRRITYAFVGLGALILVLTIVFWRATRPALLLAKEEARSSSPTSPTATRPGTDTSAAADAATAAPSTPARPAKIPASVILASPPGGLSTGVAAVGTLPTLAQVGSTAAAAATAPVGPQHAAGDEPPPSGEPVIDAPPPIDDIPLGAPKPLVGSDSAWIIEPESASGLTAEAPTATDFTEAASAPVVEYPTQTQALISALSAIPDKEPTVVRFDDPPVERVVAKGPPPGAPGFDRIAKEATANHEAVRAVPRPEPDSLADPGPEPDAQLRPEPRRGSVDDMALMASALSSLPQRDRPEAASPPDVVDVPEVIDVPEIIDGLPVGEFYDQDLDPGDPPGR